MAILWNVDPSHSEVLFKIKHLVISTVTGSFRSYEGTIESDDEHDFSNAQISFSVDANSIDTRQEDRDNHLKSSDFFLVEKYPKLSFKSTSFEKKSEDNYLLHGDLTIKDKTHPVNFEVEYGGLAKDGYGNVKIGFEAKTKIKRNDFGLTFSAVTEAGKLVLGDEIKIELSLQFARAQA